MIVRLPADPGRYEPEPLRALLAPLYNAPVAVVDLRDADYLTSVVLSALFVLHRHRSERRRTPVRLVRTSRFVQRILEAVQFDETFEIYDCVEDALAPELETPHAFG